MITARIAAALRDLIELHATRRGQTLNEYIEEALRKAAEEDQP